MRAPSLVRAELRDTVQSSGLLDERQVREWPTQKTTDRQDKDGER